MRLISLQIILEAASMYAHFDTGDVLPPYFNSWAGIASSLGLAGTHAIMQSVYQGYSKENELRADSLAVDLSSKAGYEPQAFISFFKKMILFKTKFAINKTNYVSSLINAEPGLDERIRNAEKIISK